MPVFWVKINRGRRLHLDFHNANINLERHDKVL